MRQWLADSSGLVLTALGGVAGVFLSSMLLGDKGLGGAAVIAAALGAAAGLALAVRTVRARG